MVCKMSNMPAKFWILFGIFMTLFWTEMLQLVW